MHRPAARERELPQRSRAARRLRDHRRRRGASRLRLPLRERALRRDPVRAPGSSSSARAPSTSASWATRSRPSAPPSASAFRSCPARRAASPPTPRGHAIAREIGFPVLVKAAAGGGGRGMKVARTEADLAMRARDRARRGQGRLRRRRGLPGEIPGEAAPHRDPGAGRRPGQRDPSRRARLLAAAAAPEGAGRKAPRPRSMPTRATRSARPSRRRCAT